LNDNGYIHYKVNHSLHFKDPETGTHTNAIESSWRAAKAICTSSGRKKSHIPGNLARYMFYKQCTELNVDRTLHFFKFAGMLYDATSPGNFAIVDEAPDVDDVDVE
jgi:purine nucleoside phosphorylase